MAPVLSSLNTESEDDAAEANCYGGPATPAYPFTQQQGGEGGHVDRAGHVIGHDLGERQFGQGPEEK